MNETINQKVLRHVRRNPDKTAHEIAGSMGLHIVSVRPALSQLLAANAIMKTGKPYRFKETTNDQGK